MKKKHENDDFIPIKLIIKNHALFFRTATNFDKKEQSNFWYIIKDKHLSLEEYSSKRRYEIRQALKKCIVQRVDGAYIKQHCYNCYNTLVDHC